MPPDDDWRQSGYALPSRHRRTGRGGVSVCLADAPGRKNRSGLEPCSTVGGKGCPFPLLEPQLSLLNCAAAELAPCIPAKVVQVLYLNTELAISPRGGNP